MGRLMAGWLDLVSEIGGLVAGEDSSNCFVFSIGIGIVAAFSPTLALLTL